MLQVTPVFLSLSGAFQVRFCYKGFRAVHGLTLTLYRQPTGILHVKNQQFAGFGGYSNLYKADLTFSNQSKPLPVRQQTTTFHLLNDALTALQIMAKAFRILPNDQESNDQFSNVCYG